MTEMPLTENIDAERIQAELEQLAQFSDAPPPAVTRVLFTQCDLAARAFLKELFTAAGLEIREDAVGNVFATWLGKDPALPPVATGSHTDAIPHSGRYDGAVGVLGGLEAIRALKRSGFQPRRSIELIMFTAEEPTRFGLGCLGSRLLSGSLDPCQALELRDQEGRTLEEVRLAAGCRGELREVRLPKDAYHAFVELHIEQGPLLEREAKSIGIVTAIAAPAAVRAKYEGHGGHAGAVLMPERNDSLLAAAELALAVEQAAKQHGGDDTVATTGVLRVHPGAINSIPSRVTLEIDARDIDGPRRDRVLNEIEQQIDAIGVRRGQKTQWELINADPPATCDKAIVSAVEQSCQSAGVQYEKLISRAYHDALFMSAIAPTGMIFIPCRDGVSHRPEEFAKPEDIAVGARVLASTLTELAEQE